MGAFVLGWIENRYLGRLPLLLGALVLLVTSGVLAFAVYAHRPAAPEGPRQADGAFIVVFEVSPCEACERFRETVGKSYQRSPSAQQVALRYFDITGGAPPRRFQVSGEVYRFPTAVAFDPYGREIDRLTGTSATLDRLTKLAASATRKSEREIARLSR